MTAPQHPWLCASLIAMLLSGAVHADNLQKLIQRDWLRQVQIENTGTSLLPQQDALGAIDGRRGRKGFRTQKENTAWWQVDLGQNYPVQKLHLFGSSGSQQLDVWISNDSKDWKQVRGDWSPEIKLPDVRQQARRIELSAAKARYIRLQVQNDSLSFSELEVFQQGDAETNIALQQTATQSSVCKTSNFSGGALVLPDAEYEPYRNVSEVEINKALDLAGRTLEYVQKRLTLPSHAKQLTTLQQQWKNQLIPQAQYKSFFFDVRTLRRQIILQHPDLDFESILINRTPPTLFSHNGDQHLGRHSRSGPGLTLLSDWKTLAPTTKEILHGKLPTGSVRNPDLHYDADKVVFAFCDHEATDDPLRRRFFLYEAAIDGSWVRQITGTANDPLQTWNNRATVLIEDNDPAYLPDGDIAFISTRSQTFGRCHNGRYNPAFVLYRCDREGKEIQQLSFGNENEYEPVVLNDGRIVFTRWEYTNRHEMLFHMLWWCRPDGTHVSNFYGNDTLHPMMVTEVSTIPGSHKVVATAMGHHSYSTGTIILIDTYKGENGERPITRITPETPYSETEGWPAPHYSHPHAITDELFLVSRANHPIHQQKTEPPPNNRGIYLIDPTGGRELIYEDPDVASFSPIAVRKRERPPVIPSHIQDNTQEEATLYIQNAYLTRNDPHGKIQPGTIKAIRVNALGVQPRAKRSLCSKTVPVEIPKKVLGTVPVAEDGSAIFKVPSQTALQLQILDDKGRAILTEKSFFYLQPGETRGCIGCHEKPGTSPAPVRSANLMRQQPHALTPAAGPRYEGGLSFMRTVQPVLDQYCISCHGIEKTEGGVNLVHDGTLEWPRPYLSLIKLGDHALGKKNYMWEEKKNISRPYDFYAATSRLSRMLENNHGGCNMDRDSYMRIIEWLDLNAQCYGDLFPNKLEERTLDPEAVKKLRRAIQKEFGKELAQQPERALINVAQPDESRILMMPLAKEAGGWGQIEGWSSKESKGYQNMAARVEACIIRNPNENTRGWEPAPEQGAAEPWVSTERKSLNP